MQLNSHGKNNIPNQNSSMQIFSTVTNETIHTATKGPFTGKAGQPRERPRSLRRPISSAKPKTRTNTPNESEKKTRNTGRGLRSKESTQKRRETRSIKRNHARRSRRKSDKGAAAPARELPPQKPSLKFDRTLKIVTLNVRGLIMYAGKRDEIDKYLQDKRADVLFIQETHMGEASREKRKHFTWYFSGGAQAGTIYHGVGIVIRNELRN